MQNKFGSKHIFGLKKCVSKNFQGPMKILSKNLIPEEFCVQKVLRCKTNFGSKNFVTKRVNKFFLFEYVSCKKIVIMNDLRCKKFSV